MPNLHLDARATDRPVPRPDHRPAPWVLDRIAAFQRAFAGGFDDPRWRRRVRGIDARWRRRHHRQPAIADAAERLSRERLTPLLTAWRFGRVIQLVANVLRRTDLVRGRLDLARMTRLDVHRERGVAIALGELLHGGGRYRPRFEAWLEELVSLQRRPPSWRLVTAIGALVHPEREVVIVRPRDGWRRRHVPPALQCGPEPTWSEYRRARERIIEVREDLRRVGLRPRDLLDVRDFLQMRLRPRRRRRSGSGREAVV